MSAVPREVAIAGESLVILTQDVALSDTLRAIDTSHSVFTVPSETDLASHLIAEHAGVAVLDADAVASPIGRLTERLKSQFPDLVLIVAGGIDGQGALAAQVTNGTVYRFLHKPVSEQRVKLFVDAAWRRHSKEHADIELAATNELPRYRPGAARNTLIIGGAAALAAIALIGLWLTRTRHPAQQAPLATPGSAELQRAVIPRDDVLESVLARADEAMQTGALVAPSGRSAADLYRQALQRNPNDPRAGNGLEKVIDKLLSAAEEQLLAQHLDAAQRLTEQARAIKADHVRVAFLMAQIGKERERALISQARQAASSGNLEQAIAVLDGASPDGRRSSLVTEARQELEKKKLGEGVRDLLGRASDALTRGALVEPAENNARFFIESARALAPNDPGVTQAEHQLLDRVVAEARKALAADNAEQGQVWIQAAADSGLSPAEVAPLTREAQRIRSAAKADALARLALLFNQRITQGRVVDPPSDSAKFYLAQLMQADPAHPSTQSARQSFATRALDEAKGAVSRRDYAGARLWLAEAQEAGVDQASISGVERGIKTAPDTAPHADDVVNASLLRLTHYVTPEFPMRARQESLSGWVDLQVIVRTTGAVTDVTVVGAEPAGMFEQAALAAVRKWRYQPVLQDGHPVEQHARVRVRFAFKP